MLAYDDPNIHQLLLEIGLRFDVDADIPEESELFWRDLLSTYDGQNDPAAMVAWLNEQIPRHFAALGERPRWIQGKSDLSGGFRPK
jgi:hypothetical protein